MTGPKSQSEEAGQQEPGPGSGLGSGLGSVLTLRAALTTSPGPPSTLPSTCPHLWPRVLTGVGRLMAGAPTRQQCHSALEAVQVRTEGHPVALQELQVGVAGHQASKGIISTACHRVDQLLGGL